MVFLCARFCVDVVAFQLQHFGFPVGGILGAVAELERSIITERVHAGLHRARKEGKQLGRPKVIVDREKVRTLYAAGSSVRTIAAALGLRKSTVYNIVAVN